jgi:hypothetical protein
MSVTKRHHFIPIFYLKQFTNDNGFFYIYDVKKNRFKNGGKKFAPSTQFYEHYGNTTFHGLESSDFIEHSYTRFDNRIAGIYKKVVYEAADQEYTLQPAEWALLQYFVSIMYWRNPSTKPLVDDLIKNATSIRDLKLKVMDSTTNQPADLRGELQYLEKLKNEPDFYKFYRSMLPGLTYPEIFEKDNDFAHIFPFPLGLPKLVSDNPIIYRHPGKRSIHTDEFIFPLTPSQILIRSKYKSLIIHSAVRIFIDMMLVMQAKEYVSSTDLKYPISLKEDYYKRFNSIEDLRTAIFKYIFQRI